MSRRGIATQLPARGQHGCRTGDRRVELDQPLDQTRPLNFLSPTPGEPGGVPQTGAEMRCLLRLAWSLQPALPALALCPRRPGSQTSTWPRERPPLLPAVLPGVRVRTCLRAREAQEVQGAWACVPMSRSLLGGDR